jgi:hypothetical protein
MVVMGWTAVAFVDDMVCFEIEKGYYLLNLSDVYISVVERVF